MTDDMTVGAVARDPQGRTSRPGQARHRNVVWQYHDVARRPRPAYWRGHEERQCVSWTSDERQALMSSLPMPAPIVVGGEPIDRWASSKRPPLVLPRASATKTDEVISWLSTSRSIVHPKT